VTKAVIDANVWVSGLIARGNSSRIVDLFRSGGFQAFCSPELIDELAVLARPRIAQRIQPELAHQLLDLLKTKAGFASLESIPQISRDPKDDAYLACARAAKCDFLVSGDKDLLVLKEYEGTKIVSPADFVRLVQASKER
jgi:uncharacterized protein